MYIFFRRYLLIFLILIFSFSFLPDIVSAIGFTPPPFRDSSFVGQYVGQSIPDPIEIPAGSSKEVIVRFKNMGSATWNNTGLNYVSVYTVDPNYRKSVFAGSDWISSSQVAKILKTTKVGEIAEVKINLHAPEKLGEYTEKFYLASENKTWIKSTYFYLKIKVVKSSVEQVKDNLVVEDKKENTNLTQDNKKYQAQLLGLRSKYLESNQGGEELDFRLKYKNIGASDLLGSSLKAELSLGEGSLVHKTWENNNSILLLEDQVGTNKDTKWLRFKFNSPIKSGEYEIIFYLEKDGVKINGSEVKVNLFVKKDGITSVLPTPIIETPKLTRALVSEPNIKVRLSAPKTPVKFKSNFDYKVYSGNTYKGDLPKGVMATLAYYGEENGVYSFKSSHFNFSSEEFIRFVPYNMQDYFEIPTFARTVTWKGPVRFDEYRGIMEYVYSNRSKEVYIVNELPLSYYIAGIGEMSDSEPFEYMKALLIAARSYAYYKIYNGTPSELRTWDVYASTIDQLYLGYKHELMSPNTVLAQKETHGQMVTYNGEVVITPYFGNSDGMTRTWKEVWGGTNKPWIVPVETVYDKGKKMFGHGVGISMVDAAERAKRDGWNYEQILKYYYTGVEVERVY